MYSPSEHKAHTPHHHLIRTIVSPVQQQTACRSDPLEQRIAFAGMLPVVSAVAL